MLAASAAATAAARATRIGANRRIASSLGGLGPLAPGGGRVGGTVGEQDGERAARLVEIARGERAGVAGELDAGPGLGPADLLQPQPELVGPEVRLGVVGPRVAEDRAGDRRALAGRVRPVLDADGAAERGPVPCGHVAAGEEARGRGAAAGVGLDPLV